MLNAIPSGASPHPGQHWRGAPLGDICAVATWALSYTFARFYRVNVAAPTLWQQLSCLGRQPALNEVGA